MALACGGTRGGRRGRTWTARRAQACLFGSCDAIIIANQITQIAHMVTQIGKMVEQLSSLDGVLATTTELVTSNDIGMGNIGRLREVTDAGWLIGRHGIGLSTSTSSGGAGAFLQRSPGVTDEAGWLDVLAAPGLGDPSSATVRLPPAPHGRRRARQPDPGRGGTAETRMGPAGPAARQASLRLQRRADRGLAIAAAAGRGGAGVGRPRVRRGPEQGHRHQARPRGRRPRLLQPEGGPGGAPGAEPVPVAGRLHAYRPSRAGARHRAPRAG